MSMGIEQSVIETPEELACDYVFLQQIGEGSNGKTYLARHLQSGKKVAVKCLKMNQAEDFKQIELFEREAEVLESIHFPGIPTFYKSIIPKDKIGNCFLIQEFIDAPSLLDLLEQGKKFSENEVLDILKEVAFILVALQTNYVPPIIHRDIKPSNILYFQGGSQGAGKPRVYLIDFGTVTSTLKKTGGSTVAGTYGYMPPEQMINDVCIQSDFYALGATALHLLTGVAPYQMPSNVFRLEYDYFLRTKAPFTSVNMAELLGLLLAPEVEKRPKNVFELLYCIEQVQKNCNPKSSRNAEAHFRPLMDFQIERSHAKTSLVLRNAEKIRGEIMCVSEMWCAGDYFSLGGKFRPGLEYIFCYKDVYWCGFWPFHNFVDEDLIVFLNKMKKQEYPISCTVEFSTDEPRLNRLVSFECEGKTYQTLKQNVQ